MAATLYYIHDPMCSWCWGFAPALTRLLDGLPPHVSVVRLLGGLAPDSQASMPHEMRAYLRQTWRDIQQRIPGTKFNFDFWTRCAPRRSTWPACRAVIAARRQDPSLDEAITAAIQRAYYLHARNPSDRDTLIALAGEIGADTGRFAADLDSPETRQELEREMTRARHLGVNGFPSLVLDPGDGAARPVPVNYHAPRAMLEAIAKDGPARRLP